MRSVQDAKPAQRGKEKVFFQNGVFHSLDQVLHFYVERETNPAKWYPNCRMARSIATMTCRCNIAAMSMTCHMTGSWARHRTE